MVESCGSLKLEPILARDNWGRLLPEALPVV
jgi:hypothetical protein